MSSAGNELTADDVLWRYARSLTLGSPSGGFLRSAVQIDNPDNLQKEGRYTFTINMNGPNYLAEVIHAHHEGRIPDSAEYMKHATEDDPWATKWAGTNFSGFGAWKVTEYVPGESWTYERNENFYDPDIFTGNVTKVINRVIPNSANRVALLESGDLDLAFDLQASELIKLQNTPGIKVDNLPGNLLQWLGFTFGSDTTPELMDLNVRLAIAYALPYDLLVERPYLGFAEQMKSTVAPAYAGFDVVSQIWGDRKRDMDKAKEYMDQSPYPKGFTTTLHYDIGQPGQEESAIIIKSALAELGINVEIVKVQTGDFFNLGFGEGFPGLYLFKDFAGTPDTNFGTHLWLKSNAVAGPGRYSNEEVDKLWAEVQRTTEDAEKRVQLQKEIDDVAINKDPWGVPLHALGFQGARRENVGGWWWQAENSLLWTKAWKK